MPNKNGRAKDERKIVYFVGAVGRGKRDSMQKTFARNASIGVVDFDDDKKSQGRRKRGHKLLFY